MPTIEAVEKYREWQESLRRHGISHYANSLFLDLCREVDRDPFLDVCGFEVALDRIHAAAYPVSSTRPPRLTGELLEDIRE